MRRVASVLACVGIAVTVAGCNPSTDKTYFRQGVGVDLYATDNVSTLQAQADYFERICAQAGVSCTADAGPVAWSAVVWAGMNDIDERCDGYLTWLDDIRRSQAPLTKQITDTGTATDLILHATGASGASMAVVAAAFGLASNTFTNFSSRLILEVPHSTVQAVVLSRQKEYREDLFGTATKAAVVIPNRPAAIYALRSYLRLCMPITIEMEINNTIATFERGGGAALSGANSKSKFISAKSAGGVMVIRNVNAPLQRLPQLQPTVGPTRLSPYESKFMPPRDMRMVLDALCQPTTDTDLGEKDSPARKALAKFLADNGKRSVEIMDRNAFRDVQKLVKAKKRAC